MSQKLWRKYLKTHKARHAHTKVKNCFQNLVQLRLKNKNVLVPINNFQPKTWKLLPNIYLLLSPCWAKLWVDFALDFVKHKAVTLIPLNMKKNIVNYGTRISIIFQNWFYNDFVLLNKYMDDKDLLHIRSYNPFSLSQYFLFLFSFLNVMRCATWYHLHNLKNVKNNHGGVLLLVKLQASACKLRKWYQIAQRMAYYFLRLKYVTHQPQVEKKSLHPQIHIYPQFTSSQNWTLVPAVKRRELRHSPMKVRKH